MEWGTFLATNLQVLNKIFKNFYKFFILGNKVHTQKFITASFSHISLQMWLSLHESVAK